MLCKMHVGCWFTGESWYLAVTILRGFALEKETICPIKTGYFIEVNKAECP